MDTIITESAESTKNAGSNLAKKLKKQPNGKKEALVIALLGDLGSGKTTFIQGLAAGLGVKESVLSPTFLILKQFPISFKGYANFYHIDAYRLKNPKELSELGFKDLIDNPENIIVIEWADKVPELLKQANIKIEFSGSGSEKRLIKVSHAKS